MKRKIEKIFENIGNKKEMAEFYLVEAEKEYEKKVKELTGINKDIDYLRKVIEERK